MSTGALVRTALYDVSMFPLDANIVDFHGVRITNLVF